VGLLVLVASAAFAVAVARTDVPSPNEVATSEATIVYWSDGTELGRLGEATRRSVLLADVPEVVQRAVLAAEDRDFYEHGGISPVSVVRAVLNNVTGGSLQGGSTITQQYAKNAFLTQERSWTRKLRETLLAVKLETLVSKDQILNDYLNTIYFGRGAYGIEAAAIAYFGVPAAELTPAQGAVLASLIKSPNGLAPEDQPEQLRARWGYVLDAMVERGWLTQQQRQQAEFPRIIKQRATDRLGGQTGFLLNAVTTELITLGFDETEIQRGGLHITSTFDRRAQRAAVRAVQDAGPQSATKGLRIGLAAVRPGTGEVIAMYGGRDFIDDQINNATRPFAQAGSTFKPFALAAATEAGLPLKSVWNGDSPATIKGYTLTNYGDRSYGAITLLKATENSVNTAYVEVEDAVGVQAVADAALRAGVPADTPGLNLDQLDLTFVLGTASPSGLSMANAYATFAAQGQQATPTVINEVRGPNDGLLYTTNPQTTTAFDPDVANTVTYALVRTVKSGTAFAAASIDRPAAAKTGTTDDNKSAWFVGYTPQLAAAVLMAKEDADGMPISLSGTGGLRTVTGGSFPAAMWSAFMSAALADQPVEDFPSPPKSALEKLDCPTVLPAASASSQVEGVVVDLPPGCPSPSAAEFDPSALPTDVLPSASDLVPSEGAPTVPGDVTPTEGPTGQPTPAPTNPAPTNPAPTKPAPPTDGPPEIPGLS
jgi:membrane peptidoglycan carboxypeptidase